MTAAETLCPVCCRTEPNTGWTICGKCHQRISDDLARIAELVEASARWTPRKTGNAGVRTVPGSKPPLSVHILDAQLGLGGGICDPDPYNGRVDPLPTILPTLESWIRLVREMAHLAPYGAATEAQTVTVGSSVQFLRSWLPWASEAVEFPIDDYAAEIRSLRASLDSLDPERDRPGLRIACPGDHPDADGRLCGYRLVIETGAGDRQPVVCVRCGTEWDVRRLVLVAQSTGGGMRAWATAAELADHLRVGTATIGKWARRGLVAKMRTPDGWVYDIRDTVTTYHTEALG